MRQIAAWFGRTFPFPISAELFPNVCARLRGTPARLEELMRGTGQRAVLLAKRAGKWSAQEHAGHLADLEPLWLARVEDYIAGREQLTVADLRNRKTEERDHNAGVLEEILAEFRREREKLLARADAAPFTRAILHPRLRVPMSVVDHLHFVAEHDDHHLAHIRELVEG
jgi:uncharacterized damage-inducible protein DinB